MPLREEVRLGQEGEEAPERLGHLHARPKAVDRAAVGRAAFGDRDLLEPVAHIQHVGGADLLPVVVLRRDPEDREDGPARRRLEAPRECRGREPLVEGVERTPEESRLLPRDDDVASPGDEGREPLLSARAAPGECGSREPAIRRPHPVVDLPRLREVRARIPTRAGDKCPGHPASAEPGFDEPCPR